MHAVKCGWVGQTFALAKRNESGGRKSRIRRSKEERKEMVESFIKKYQRLNNGKFPSLNLTHKEVGGSFYTVREIVREVIQENRVLGPAKFLPEEQNADQLLEQSPLGTISTKPQTSFISQSGSAVLIDQHQCATEESEKIFDGLSSESEQEFDNEKFINGSHIDVESEQSDKPKVAKVIVGELVQAERSTKQVANVTQMADVIAETFPVSTAITSSEAKDAKEILEENEVDKVLVAQGEDLSTSTDEISSSESDRLVENQSGAPLETKSDMLVEVTVENPIDPLAQSSNSSVTKEGIVNDTEAAIGIEMKSSHNEKEAAATRVVNAPNSSQTETTNSVNAIARSSNSITREVEVTNKADDVQHRNSFQKGSNPTQDRTNRGRLRGASKETAKAETNAIWATFRSFIVAFVKFWTE